MPELAVEPACIGDAQEDDVPIVTLDVLEVLHEERAVVPWRKERFEALVLASSRFQLVLDGNLLSQVERADPQREALLLRLLKLLAGERDDCVGYPAGFGPLIPASS